MASTYTLQPRYRAPFAPAAAASSPAEAMLLKPALTQETQDARRDEDGDEPLAAMLREVSRELESDGTLVTWHDGEGSPVLLFADGRCERRSAMREALVEIATEAAAYCPLAPHPQWRALEGQADLIRDAGALTTSLRAGTGVVTITGLFLRVGTGTRARAREAAGRLMPLVQPFFRLWTERLRTLSRVRGLTAAVNNSDVGIVLVNRRGAVQFTNAAADALIARGDGVRRSGGMLSGTRLADTLRLQAAIEHVVQDGEPLRSAGAPVVALHRQKGRPLLAAVVGGDAATTDMGVNGPDESAAVIYLFDPEQDLRPLVEPACKLYGLSPVETRLACLLTDGISLAEAAERMHVREQTARSYLKQIFLKTETNRQAELVWLMLKSSVRTAPGCRAVLV